MQNHQQSPVELTSGCETFFPSLIPCPTASVKVGLHACDRYCSTQRLKNQSVLIADPPTPRPDRHFWHLMEERPLWLLRWDVSSQVRALFWRGCFKLTFSLYTFPLKTLFLARLGRFFSCCPNCLRARLMTRSPQEQVGERSARLTRVLSCFWGNCMTRFRTCAFAASFSFISSSSDRYNRLENRYKLIIFFQGCFRWFLETTFSS